MDNISNTNNREGSESTRGFSLREWVLLCCVMLFMVCFGIVVIVTREASAGRGFGGGPVTLDPASAWYMGLALIFGGVILPLGYVAAKRSRQTTQQAKDTQTIAALSSQGISREEAEIRIAEAHAEKQKAVRKEGVRYVLIGVGLMMAGFI